MNTTLERINSARLGKLKRWLLGFDDTPPDDLTFKEINKALDEIEERVRVARERYPYRKPSNSTEAIIRNLPPHLTDCCPGRPTCGSEVFGCPRRLRREQ